MRHPLAAPSALLAVLLLAGCTAEQPASLILTGGTIRTMDSRRPLVEAVAVQGGRILAAGSRGEVFAHQGIATRVLDLQGGLLLPGLTDAHAHLTGLGRALDELDLVGTGSREEVARRVRERLRTVLADEWVLGRGWDQNDWPDPSWPTAGDLAGSESHPVLLRRVDGHAAWANRAALERAGITAETPDPPGGRILRDTTGRPTGVLIDNAVSLVAEHVPAPTLQQRRRWLRLATAHCNERGLTGVHDAGVDSATLALYRELARTDSLTMRVYAMLEGERWDEAVRGMERGVVGGPGELVHARAVKLYMDGALGSRGAALLEPYSDEPGTRGLLMHSREELARLAATALEHGFQVCAHAIGDRAVRTTLLAYHDAARSVLPALRWRVEHAQIVAPGDIERFAAWGVVPSMQPTHATSDMPWAPRRLGQERIEGAYAWRDFLEAGCRLPLGSDFPVERADPRLGLWAAVTCADTSGHPPGGYRPGQQLSLEEALAGFTTEAAWAAFAEGVQGVIAPGAVADMVLFDADFVGAGDPRAVLEAEVRMTLVDGRVVYAAPGVERP